MTLAHDSDHFLRYLRIPWLNKALVCMHFAGACRSKLLTLLVTLSVNCLVTERGGKRVQMALALRQECGKIRGSQPFFYCHAIFSASWKTWAHFTKGLQPRITNSAFISRWKKRWAQVSAPLCAQSALRALIKWKFIAHKVRQSWK